MNNQSIVVASAVAILFFTGSSTMVRKTVYGVQPINSPKDMESINLSTSMKQIEIAPYAGELSELEVWAVQSEYQSLLNRIDSNRQLFGRSYQQAQTPEGKQEILDKSRDYIIQSLVGEVFPLWLGTQWDFNGISETPQSGQIACGYFVSTTLKHAGFELNRYKVAQQAASIIVKTLCPPDQVQHTTALKDLLSYARQHENQLYIVGLDNHVGFIEKTDDGIYFTHSSYIDPVCVVREKALTSPALSMSNNYVFAPLFDGKVTLEKWLLGKPFPIRN